MTFVELLCEGASDVPIAREVLTRHFGLVEGQRFRIHPHRGKGRLPTPGRAATGPADGLLNQLPAKLRNYGRHATAEYETVVVVLVDADDDPCEQLKADLLRMYDGLDARPRTLFRIAVEETESWFLADPDAVARAYPKANRAKLNRHPPDAVCGAWERLAEAIGREPARCTGRDKAEWATAISPHVTLDRPRSPSLRATLSGIASLLGGTGG